jgi:hypothetical protein
MIYIVEIPHQRKATAWSASSEEDFISRVLASHEQSRSDSPLPDLAEGEEYRNPIFEECETWLGHDLHALHIFKSEEEAREFLQHPGFTGHQAITATAALERELGIDQEEVEEENQ